MKRNRRQVLAMLGSLAMWPATYSFADGERRRSKRHNDGDHDDVAAALKRGDILPLNQILKEVRKQYKGEIVGIEFEREDGVWVYEFKIVRPDNRYIEVYVDARTKRVIKVEGQ